ncbi:hypothetical protein ACRALDRAFT_205138 [Sodiomyces alcalophilus JCM 7366]|uniref:uncharacterized protein n=1 Tax=Sodiomyces alcalophilus JCM 7366 TaxID=591952 RepID=UPI0039B369D3
MSPLGTTRMRGFCSSIDDVSFSMRGISSSHFFPFYSNSPLFSQRLNNYSTWDARMVSGPIV